LRNLLQSLLPPADLLLLMPRYIKRLAVVVCDICFCILATWVSFYLILGEFGRPNDAYLIVSLSSIFMIIPTFSFWGLYRVVFRFVGTAVLGSVAAAIALYGLIFSIVFTVIGVEIVPRSVGVIQPMLLFFFVAASRLVASFWLRESQERSGLGRLGMVLVYGAGSAGRQLAEGLKHENELRLCAFVDDDPRLHGQTIEMVPVHGPAMIDSLILRCGISCMFLAIPSLPPDRKRQILKDLAKKSLNVRVLPSLRELTHTNFTFRDAKPLDLEDLLGRPPVEPNIELLQSKICGKCVFVTGAGGSIGRELCIQILSLRPDKLVLLDNSEYALYTINEELLSLIQTSGGSLKTQIIPLLSSVTDSARLNTIFSVWPPNIIYHAAAYKHVPIVERNPLEGVKTNVFGTLAIVNVAVEMQVPDFVLISTDKAVRPANVMGATKRMAEKLVLSRQNCRQCSTRLSIVRFGNVLGSSGSVIPKFREQLKTMGPLTVTHPDMTRFLMTIPEAAQLVIQASALADGGEVFVLDMGDPVKIVELARQMIYLHGLSEKTEYCPEGDVEIQFTGLRPGEKLFEELFYGDSAFYTEHPKIMRVYESEIVWSELSRQLEELDRAVVRQDAAGCVALLRKFSEDFKSLDGVLDWVERERLKHGGL